MYLVSADGKTNAAPDLDARGLGGVAGVVARGVALGWRWWKERDLQQQRRTARKQLFLLETMAFGPKQRVVLMRCGSERFLVGLGAEGVTSVVRVEQSSPSSADVPLVAGGDGPWA